MSDNLLTEQLQKKWQPVLEHPEMPEIKDEYRKSTTAVLLENQEQALNEAHANAVGGGMSPHVGGEGNIAGFDPILISLVRRAMPNLIAYDICGVQPMTGPTGLIFAMRAKYGPAAGGTVLGEEAFYAEAGNTSGQAFGGSIDADGSNAQADIAARGQTSGYATTDPFGLAPNTAANIGVSGGYGAGSGMSTSAAETLTPATMGFSIERIAVEAHSRALQAEYTTELAQDLKAVHGLDAEAELANILSTEILAEINREVVRNINVTAVLGCNQGDLDINVQSAFLGATIDGMSTGTLQKGVYNLLKDSDGRWSAERFRGLQFQIERECNEIAKQTRRGKGNIAIVSSDVASALSMSGILDHAPAFGNLEVDDTGNTFVGVLNGRVKVYVDPYTTVNYVNVGYRGSSQYDAGVFYCPYVPLQMARAVDSTTYQPKIAFKTRYGLVNNPFAAGSAASSITDGQTPLQPRINQYYRIFRVDDIHGMTAGTIS